MTKTKKLYQEIVDYFQNEIMVGKLKPGDRIPTEYELISMFNVSRITVSRAMKELEHKGMIYRIKKKGSFVQECVGPESSKSKMTFISVVLPFDEQVGYQILRGAEKEAKLTGKYVTFHHTQFDQAKERSIIQKLVQDGTGGIIVYPCLGDQNLDLYSEMILRQFPFVVIDRNIDPLDTPYIGCDNIGGGYEITSHLIELGHKRIAFVSGEKTATTVKERFKGYCTALMEAGIAFSPDLVVDYFDRDHMSMDETVDSHIEGAKKIISELMGKQKSPTAIVASNDFIATYMMRAALRLGIVVPDQLSITGFDNLSHCSMLDVPLTTVEQSFYTIGEEAIRLLNDKSSRLKNKKITTDTKLVIRESTAPPAIET